MRSSRLSGVVSDGIAPRAVELRSSSGLAASLILSSGAGEALPMGSSVVARTVDVGFVPAAGESRLMFVMFPPDTAMTRADFDAAAFGAELGQLLPGLAETFEIDNPGMHTTDSIDYDVLLDGEITLELDDGQEVHLRKNDVAAQHGTPGTWRNTSDKPARMLFVLLGAPRADSNR